MKKKLSKQDIYNMVMNGQISPKEASILFKGLMEKENDGKLGLYTTKWIEIPLNHEPVDYQTSDMLVLSNRNDIETLCRQINDNKTEIISQNIIFMIQEEKEDIIYSIVQLLKLLMKQRITEILHFFYIYSDGDSKVFDIAQAFGSFGACLYLENPNYIMQSIGVSAELFNSSALIKNIISGELLQKEINFWISYKDGKRYTRVVETMDCDLSEHSSWIKKNSVYVIAGGLGKIGLLITDFITKQANVTLILTGRSCITSKKEEKLKVFNERGSKVIYIQADMGKKEDVQGLLQQVHDQYGELKGVFYAAGICKDSYLQNKMKEEMEEVISSKIVGIKLLDEMTKNDPLDFFVMFSSLTSVIGNVGQVDYGFANGFIDAFAKSRENDSIKGIRNGKTLAINWPLWEEGQMAPDKDSIQWMEDIAGLEPLPSKIGMDVLRHALAWDYCQVIVTYGNQNKIKDIFLNKNEKSQCYLEENSKETINQSEIIKKNTIEFLKGLLSEKTRIPVQKISEKELLEKYGLDSILAMNLTRELEKRFGTLSKTLFYEYQTLEGLAEYFLRKHDEVLKKMFHDEIRVRESSDQVNIQSKKGEMKLQIRNQEKLSINEKLNDAKGEIAIIGISGKYPMANDMEEFWNNLCQGKDCITEIPRGRWDYTEIYSPEKQKGKSYSKWGGFINGVDEFDPLFFNISPREAKFIDPQERIFLENAWHTIEDGGYTKSQLSGKKVGVFVGVMYSQYQLIGVEESTRGNHMLSSTSYASIANRTSYFFNFHGPSIALDTMCSSSMTAIHLACTSLLKGECEMALAGGVNISIHKSKYLQLSEQNFASTDGRCRTFGEGGNGYVPGEGVGAVLLKPLEKAIADNDNIYAVIKSSVVNHGGKTNGYTVPNPNLQGELIKEALELANVKPEEISYLEAHGTGTALGDPIEINGLIQAFGEDLKEQQYCAIASVKSNIGHLEAAAGIAAVAKVVLQMKHKQIVPSLHSSTLNSNIDFEHSPFYVPQKLQEWKQPVQLVNGQDKRSKRIAGISAFGAGGSNAHIILEEYEPIEKENIPQESVSQLFLFSAKNKKSLYEFVQKINTYLEQNPKVHLEQLSYTLFYGREAMEERLAFIADNIQQLIDGITAFINENDQIAGVYYGNEKNPKQLLGILEEREQIQSILESWIVERRLDKVAQLWIQDKMADISLLFSDKNYKKLHLPGYVFSKDHYWLPVKEQSITSRTVQKMTQSLLIDEVDFDMSLEADGITFKKKFNKEDYILTHHKVNGQVMLPGVSYIEMSYEIFAHMGIKDGRLERMVWLSPFTMDDQSNDKCLYCFVKKRADMYELVFQSFSQNRTVIHAKAAYFNQEIISVKEYIPLDKIKSVSKNSITEKEVYKYFNDISIEYGELFRGIQEIWCNYDNALSLIKLPEKYIDMESEYILPLTLMDCSLQTTIGILNNNEINKEKLMVPYAVDKVIKYCELPNKCYAYVKIIGKSTYDIVLVDENGQVSVKLFGLQVREVLQVKEQEKDVKGEFLVPVWRNINPDNEELTTNEIAEKESVLIIYTKYSERLANHISELYNDGTKVTVRINENYSLSGDLGMKGNVWSNFDELIEEFKYTSKIFFLGGFFTSSVALEESQDNSIIALFRLAKACLKIVSYQTRLNITIITNNTLQVFEEDNIFPYAASMFGFSKSLAKERPNWNIETYDFDLKDYEYDGILQRLPEACFKMLSKHGEEIALRNGTWYEKQLKLAKVKNDTNIKYREQGTYIILGGAGGIGMTLCEELVKDYHANVILLGRSILSEEKNSRITELNSYGGNVVYYKSDATCTEELKEVVKKVKNQFGTINGVVHSAIVLQDTLIENMDESCLRRVLAPKVQGTVALYEAIKDEELDFMLFFSSAQSFTCNAAQSNYSAGCTFKDAFAQYINTQRSFNVKIINWGYWGKVGVVSSKKYNELLEAQGILSIESDEGMKATRAILESDFNQVIYMKAKKSLFEKMGIEYNMEATTYKQEINPILQYLKNQDKNIEAEDLIPSKNESFSLMQSFMNDFLLYDFQQIGVFISDGETYAIEEISQKMGVIPMYKRLFGEILEIMQRAGYINLNGSVITVNQKVLYGKNITKDILKQQYKSIITGFKEIKAQMRLLTECMERLIDVLTGKILSTEVMFPNSSMDLVNDIYKGNKTVDNINKMVADSVKHYIELRIPQLKPDEKINILEVGAGTGGTSEGIFETISEFKNQVNYIYTDISKVFLQHGKKHYGAKYSFIQFSLLDIEKNVLVQGYKGNTYDLIIGANVIHATRNISNTLQNMKVMIKKNGWIILNEATELQDFLTLTFGLMEGWWIYDDESYRLKNAPLLSRELWKKALQEEGFRNVTFLGNQDLSSKGIDQSVILAESNGRLTVKREEPIRKDSKMTSIKYQQSPGKSIRQSTSDKVNKNTKKEFVEDAIKQSLVKVLQIPEEELDKDITFNDFGVDSILAVEITNEINEKCCTELKAIDLFNYATIEQLNNYIVNVFKDIACDQEESKLNEEQVQCSEQLEINKAQYAKEVIMQSLSNVLQIDDDKFDEDVPYTDFGVDSILAVEIIAQINTTLGIELKTTDLFNYSTIAFLSSYIVENFNIELCNKKEDDFNTIKQDEISYCIDELTSQEKDGKNIKEVAVVGISGYFPEADNVEQLWENLKSGRNSIREINRWNPEDYFDENPKIINKSYSKWGGFLEKIDVFDPHFFGISPKEAELMDPQQRLFLLEAWKALENSGYTQKNLNGLNCSVYVGCGSGDYRSYLKENNVEADAYSFMGNDDSILASRISYLLNLKGESIAINTACSSSLVAIHMACESIRSGKSKVAIAGGVTVLTTPEFYIMSSRAGMLSKTGECRAFDQGANGFVPGEAVGVVVLKDLDEAKKDRDYIYGVISGSGTNQDGKTNGITAPSGLSQTELEKQVYENFSINPENISYIEAHGTGTKLGDPIEISALTDAFSAYTQKKNYCAIGSIKSNIGHTLSAAGIASFIKVILCLQHKTLVPTIHVEKENEYINFEKSPFYVNKEERSWTTASGVPRQAAISSFGFSGTNVHLVVRELKKEECVTYKGEEKPCYLIPISTKEKKSLKSNAAKLLEWLNLNKNEVSLSDISYTMFTGRNHFAHRMVFVADTLEQLQGQLNDYVQHDIVEDVYTNAGESNRNAVDNTDKRVVQVLTKICENPLTISEYKDEINKLAALYIEGYDFTWQQLFENEQCKKILLPSYSFNIGSYWPEKQKKAVCLGRIHPLIDENVSTLMEEKMKLYVNGTEYFIADHVIGEKAVILGVAYVEMARKSGELALMQTVSSIRNIVFLKPITSEDVPADIFVKLYSNGGNVKYDIFIEDGEHKQTVYSQGELSTKIQFNGLPLQLDLDKIRERCCSRTTKMELYEGYRKKRICYGVSFQTIEEMQFNDEEVLATIKVPQSLLADFKEYVLHPSIMDGALQTVSGLIGNENRYQDEIYLPFYIGEIQIYKPLTSTCFVYAKEKEMLEMKDTKHFYIHIMDEQGQVLVTINDFSLRAVGRDVKKMKDEGRKILKGEYLKPSWKESDFMFKLQENSIDKNILIFTDKIDSVEYWRGQESDFKNAVIVEYGNEFRQMSDNHYRINPAYKEDYEQLLKVIEKMDIVLDCIFLCIGEKIFTYEEAYKDLLIGKVKAVVNLTKVLISRNKSITKQIVFMFAGIGGEPQYQAFGSFLKTTLLENRTLCGKIIYVMEDNFVNVSANWLLKEIHSNYKNDVEVMYWNGKRYKKELEQIKNVSDTFDTSIRNEGVYVITGGMGEVGKCFTKYIVKDNGGKVIILGRSSLTSEKKEALYKLVDKKEQISYMQVDVTNREEVIKAIHDIIDKFGTINGVLHCAGVLEDGLLKGKSMEEFENVMAPKIYGTLWLDEALKSIHLDFFMMCSSMASVVGNIGQSDYSYANGFMDAFAKYRNKLMQSGTRFGKTVSINWPLWKFGGMYIDEGKQKQIEKTFGIVPITNSQGVDVLEKALGMEESQLLYLYGDSEKWNFLSNQRTSDQEKKTETKTSLNDEFIKKEVEKSLIQSVSKTLKISEEDIDFDEEMSGFGFDSISFTSFCDVINEKLGIHVMPSIMFEFPTLTLFKEYLCSEKAGEIRTHLEKTYNGDENEVQIMPRSENKIIEIEETQIRRIEDTEKQTVAYTKSNIMNEPIAIIGIDGVFPQSSNIDEFWTNLEQEKDLITEIPPDRWDWKEIYGNPRTEMNKTNIIYGGFMKEISKFDPLFFGISPKEAELMDPQQRILLESVWKTIEDAGYKVTDLSDKNVGLFVGVSTSDYSDLIKNKNLDTTPQISTGNAHSILANRISYLLNLNGPSEPVDTACSSALVSLHNAVKAIQNNDCEYALVGGVNVIASPSLFISFSKGGMLCPDGRCKTFDKSANGYVRGEGVGTILLKRLSSAKNDKDHIYGIIRSSAVNHGGHSNSLTAPNPNAQGELIYKAWKDANIPPETITYIEAHGTGTSLGDPIEVNGLKKAFKKLYEERGQQVPKQAYCGIGSVKSNIGHLEASSGMAGLFKVLLSIKHKKIPASLHVKEINPLIELQNTPFYVVNHTKEWKCCIDKDGNSIPRRAGISSFGFGGVNAHVVIEEYQEKSEDLDYANMNQIYLIPISSKSPEQNHEYIERILQYMKKDMNSTSLQSIAYTLQTGRMEYECRVAFLVKDKNEFIDSLQQYLTSEMETKNTFIGRFEKKKGDKIKKIQANRSTLNETAIEWVNGAEIDWYSLYPVEVPKKISLPTYPFAKEHYWISGGEDIIRTHMKETLNPFIKANLSMFEEHKLIVPITEQHSFMKDHVINGKKVMPGAVYMEIAKSYAEFVCNEKVTEIRDISWDKAFVLEDEKEDIVIRIVKEDEVKFIIESMENIVYAKGTLSFIKGEDGFEMPLEAELFEKSFKGNLSRKACYETFSQLGISYGESFRVIEDLHFDKNESRAYIKLPETNEKEFNLYGLHPSIIDGAFQSIMGIFLSQDEQTASPIYLPFALERLTIYSPFKKECYIHARRVTQGKFNKVERFNIEVLDIQGNVLAVMNNFLAVQYDGQKADSLQQRKEITINNPMELLKMLENHEINLEDANMLMEAFYGEEV
jgi:polyketide synthase PksM